MREGAEAAVELSAEPVVLGPVESLAVPPVRWRLSPGGGCAGGVGGGCAAGGGWPAESVGGCAGGVVGGCAGGG